MLAHTTKRVSLQAIRSLGWKCHLRNVSGLQVKTRQFQSPASTDHLYPGSKLEDRFKRPAGPEKESKELEFCGYIPVNELKISVLPGPDGKNIHDVDTKVDVRFHVDSAKWLSSELKEAIKSTYAQELSKDGCLVAKSDRTRSQMMNQADALRKLREAIWNAASVAKSGSVARDQAFEKELLRRQNIQASRATLRVPKVKKD